MIFGYLAINEFVLILFTVRQRDGFVGKILEPIHVNKMGEICNGHTKTHTHIYIYIYIYIYICMLWCSNYT